MQKYNGNLCKGVRIEVTVPDRIFDLSEDDRELAVASMIGSVMSAYENDRDKRRAMGERTPETRRIVESVKRDWGVLMHAGVDEGLAVCHMLAACSDDPAWSFVIDVKPNPENHETALLDVGASSASGSSAHVTRFRVHQPKTAGAYEREG